MQVKKHIIGLMVLSAILFGCSKNEEVPQLAPLVKTVIVGAAGSSLERSFPGRVIAGQRAELSFQVSGTLSELPAKEGQHVTQGQLLAKLNPRDYENRFASAKSSREIAELNYERGKKLVGSGTIAQVTFDELKNKYDVAKSNEDIAQKALEDTKMLAPFGGMIARVYKDNFQEVQAKEKVLTLQDIQDIDILIDVPEKDIINRQGMNQGSAQNQTLEGGHVVFEGIPNKKFDVTVKEYATEADPTTQTYRVRLSMKAPENVNILPGMTATLIMSNQKKSLTELLIPASAVAVDAQGKFYVWFVKEDMTVSKESVEVGEMTRDSIRIKSGVTQGQRIVIAGLPYLEEGMKVRLFTNQY
ncbi:MAG: efflux RND transporter periplasmic adaptor subunit [Gammaproteobacteria bacterium]